jgi:hypothetical protein
MAWRLLFTSTAAIRKRKGEKNENLGRRRQQIRGGIPQMYFTAQLSSGANS